MSEGKKSANDIFQAYITEHDGEVANDLQKLYSDKLNREQKNLKNIMKDTMKESEAVLDNSIAKFNDLIEELKLDAINDQKLQEKKDIIEKILQTTEEKYKSQASGSDTETIANNETKLEDILKTIKTTILQQTNHDAKMKVLDEWKNTHSNFIKNTKINKEVDEFIANIKKILEKTKPKPKQ